MEASFPCEIARRYRSHLLHGLFFSAISLFGIGWIVCIYLFLQGVADGSRYGFPRDPITISYIHASAEGSGEERSHWDIHIPPYWLLTFVLLPFILFARDDLRSARYYRRAAWVLKHAPPKTMFSLLRTSRMERKTGWFNLASYDDYHVDLYSDQTLVSNSECDSIPILPPTSWQLRDLTPEFVEIYRDAGEEGPVVIKTSRGIVCSNPQPD